LEVVRTNNWRTLSVSNMIIQILFHNEGHLMFRMGALYKDIRIASDFGENGERKLSRK